MTVEDRRRHEELGRNIARDWHKSQVRVGVGVGMIIGAVVQIPLGLLGMALSALNGALWLFAAGRYWLGGKLQSEDDE